MNIEKMRKYASRNTPDNVEKTFDPFSDTYAVEYSTFSRNFAYQMQVKYGSRLKTIAMFQTSDWDTNKVRIQLVAKLHQR